MKLIKELNETVNYLVEDSSGKKELFIEGPFLVAEKKNKNGKIYWILTVTDKTNQLNTIKCWGIDPKKDKIWLNRPYLAKLQKDDWGFSTRSIKHNFKLLA